MDLEGALLEGELQEEKQELKQEEERLLELKERLLQTEQKCREEREKVSCCFVGSFSYSFPPPTPKCSCCSFSSGLDQDSWLL